MQFCQTSLLLLTFAATGLAAAKPKPAAPAAPAVPAAPAKPAADVPKPPPIISSEMGGRDLVFLANAFDLGKALSYLTAQAAQTENAVLKKFGEDLTRTLVAHSAVVNTVAEMRNIKAPAQSPTENRLSDKLSKLEGAKKEKAILDAFIELDERLVAAYQLGKMSSDTTISKFVEQALPQAEQHLRLVQGLAGIGPKRQPVQVVPKAEVVVNTPPTKTAPDEEATPVALSKPEVAVKPKAEAPAAPKPETPEPKPEVAAKKAELPPIPPAPEVPKKEAQPKPEAPKPTVAENPKRETPPPAKVTPPAKPEPVAEPPVEEVVPKKLEGETPPKPAKRPAFRTNVKPLSE